MNERDATYYRKAYGGIEVNFLNGYKPAADEMILPENVYKFSGCSIAETRAEGGADKNLDWFYVTKPRLFRYSIGLRAPSDILIRFSLYHRM